MPFGPFITVENEAQTRRAFKALGGAGKDLTKANRGVAKVTVAEIRSDVGSGTRQQSSAVKAFSAQANQSAAVLALKGSGSKPYAVGAFMGAKKYPQFPAWVGSSWDLLAGQGPYVVRDVFTGSGLEKVKAEYSKAIGDVLRAAGLEVSTN